MRRSAFVALFIFLIVAAQGRIARAQAVESADARGFHIDAGAMASGFQPDDGNNYLLGPGAYVDFHFSHWVQLEAEGRWLRFNQYFGETQDNYLIGPRVPVWRGGWAKGSPAV